MVKEDDPCKDISNLLKLESCVQDLLEQKGESFTNSCKINIVKFRFYGHICGILDVDNFIDIDISLLV